LHARPRHRQLVHRDVQRLPRPGAGGDLLVDAPHLGVSQVEVGPRLGHRVHLRQELLELRVGRGQRFEFQFAQFGVERRPRLLDRQPVLGRVEFQE
jgi:hypothetical protein